MAFEPGAGRTFPILSLVGGKWTTFRAFAEQVSQAAVARLGRRREVDTTRLPIGGAAGLPNTPAGREHVEAALARRFGLDMDRARALVGRYGSGADAVATFLAEGNDRLLPGVTDVSEREILRLVRHEMAATVEDVIFRRTSLAMQGRLSRALLERIAAIVAEEIGRSTLERDATLAY